MEFEFVLYKYNYRPITGHGHWSQLYIIEKVCYGNIIIIDQKDSFSNVHVVCSLASIIYRVHAVSCF